VLSFVGLGFMRLIPLPDFPPMNSEVPRRWRNGMARGDGEPGDMGGDAIPVSVSRAEGLNEELVSAAGIDRLLSSAGTSSFNLPADSSIVETGRLPVALEYEGGAELDKTSRAGKTKGGLGRGLWLSPGWIDAIVAISNGRKAHS